MPKVSRGRVVPHPHQPARFRGGRERASETEARRDGEAVADVTLAVAQELVIGGQYDGVIAGGLGPIDEFAGEAAILVDEDLHPSRRHARGRYVFQSADGGVACAVGNAGRSGGARRCQFAARPIQAGETCRRDGEWHRELHAEQIVDRSRTAAPFSGRGRNPTSAKASVVATKRPLVFRAAIGEVEHRARQDGLRRPA